MIGDKVITSKGGHFEGFKEEINKSYGSSDDDFFLWFDSAENVEESFYSGEWDFSFYIFSRIAEYIRYPSKITALEIGYGGGRLLKAASKYFNHVIGVDIHDKGEFVKKYLNRQGVDNIDLFTLQNKTFPLEDNSVDVIYSFIVFQHLEKVEILEKYIEECSRVLKSGGVCCIYFGRYSKFSKGRYSKAYTYLDKIYEFFAIGKGYLELNTRVNEKNLILTLRKIKSILKRNMFIVDAVNISSKKITNNIAGYGGQYGVVFHKL